MPALPSDDIAEVARGIRDATMYMTLATADADGRPWASPVWFAPGSDDEFLWVSRPERRHSQNIAVRPEIALVIFDSTVPIGGGQALFVEATAGQLQGPELERGIAAFSRRSLEAGGTAWDASTVQEPSPFRLYRATATVQYVLDEHENRVPVPPGAGPVSPSSRTP
jgi:hypothetical protein